jgi:hypothetical protein
MAGILCGRRRRGRPALVVFYAFVVLFPAWGIALAIAILLVTANRVVHRLSRPG